MPGDDAAGGEFHFDYGGAFAGIAFEDGEGSAVGNARDGGEFGGDAFSHDGGVGGFLGGCTDANGPKQKERQKGFAKMCRADGALYFRDSFPSAYARG